MRTLGLYYLIPSINITMLIETVGLIPKQSLKFYVIRTVRFRRFYYVLEVLWFKDWISLHSRL